MNRFKRVISGTSAAVLSLSSLLTMGFTGVAHATVQTCTWTGTAGDHKFSTVANWANCGGGVPQNGDNLLFDQWVGPTMNGSSNAVWLTNDLPATTILGNITSTATSTQGYVMIIDSVNVAAGAAVSVTGVMHLDIDNLQTTGALTVDGANITNVTASAVTVSNNAAVWNTSAAITVKSGSELIGSVSETSYSYSNSPAVTIENGAKLFLCGTKGNAVIDGAITFGGGSGAVPEILIEPCMGAAGAPAIPSSGAKFTGNITLLSDAIITSSNKLLTMDGTLTANSHKLTINAGNTSMIMGHGTVGDIALASGSIIAPGASPGCLSTGNISWVQGAVYSFDLGGTVACTGYDQINATGTVDLGNGTLTINPYGGFVPKQGDTFTIITNDGSDTVTGIFAGLVEGATFTQNGVVFKITYKGGDGNDTVLTVQNQPTAPDTGFALISANPLVTLGATAGAALVLLAMARKTRPAHARAHASRRRK